MRRIKTAIHLHTHYSYDSNVSPADLIAEARRVGLDCVAITDHDTIEGALEARAFGDLPVIVGEEVSTAEGHLLGLFLQRCVPAGLSVEQTAAEIHAQGGLVLAPHPFCSLCEDSLQGTTWRVAEQLDAVEVFNAQNPLPWQDRRAAEFARRSGLPACVGMDAHLCWLPETYQVMPVFGDSESFLAALSQAELRTSRVSYRYYALMGARHLWDKIFPKPLPAFGLKAELGVQAAEDEKATPVVGTGHAR